MDALNASSNPPIPCQLPSSSASSRLSSRGTSLLSRQPLYLIRSSFLYQLRVEDIAQPVFLHARNEVRGQAACFLRSLPIHDLLARQELREDHPEAVDIALPRKVTALKLLRIEVVECPLQRRGYFGLIQGDQPRNPKSDILAT